MLDAGAGCRTSRRLDQRKRGPRTHPPFMQTAKLEAEIAAQTLSHDICGEQPDPTSEVAVPPGHLQCADEHTDQVTPSQVKHGALGTGEFSESQQIQDTPETGNGAHTEHLRPLQDKAGQGGIREQVHCWSWRAASDVQVQTSHVHTPYS
jgi:hypothetical protein